jgi:hypothetical protein
MRQTTVYKREYRKVSYEGKRLPVTIRSQKMKTAMYTVKKIEKKLADDVPLSYLPFRG